MANELTVTLGVTGSKNNQHTDWKHRNDNWDVAAEGRLLNEQSIDTTAAGEAIDLGDFSMANAGLAMAENTDSTNFVEIGVQVAATFYPVIRIEPGKRNVFGFSRSCTPYARANGAAVNLVLEVVRGI